MLQPSDVHPLTDFKRKSTDHVRRIVDEGRTEVLTIDGRPKLVVMGVRAFEELTRLAELAESLDAVRDGLESMRAGKGVPARGFLEEMRKKHNIPSEDT